MTETIIQINTCKSSNEECLKYTDFIADKTEFTLVTNHQTAGKGMGKNVWFSSAGKNITASFVKYPCFLKPNKAFYLSMVSSLAVYDLLLKTGVKTQIKWPNDVWFKRQKLCGILIENTISAIGIEITRIGIGLNVNENEFPMDLPNPVSLFQLGFTNLHPNDLVKGLNLHLNAWYQRLKNQEFSEIKNHYLSHLLGYQTYLNYVDDKGNFSAKIIDINDWGYAILKDTKNRVREYEMKAVKLVL